MENPFEATAITPEVETSESDRDNRQRSLKRKEIYTKFDPIVNEILDQFIAAHRQGLWEKGSDCARRYCCHVAWFAGPKEQYADADPYDVHHAIRRRIEIRLEMDGFCNPTGFLVINFEAINKVIHVGLEKEDLVRGIKAVME